jgi:16S rRNA (cytosine1402-N4)-methyltransferase
MDPRHDPVLRDRVVALLAPALAAPEAIAVDATVGLGGHSAALLARIPTCRLIGIDRDPEALAAARTVLAPWADRVTLVHAVYDALPEVLEDLGVPAVDGVLFDLGVSSMQLDQAERGFAYAQDAPLDMRMDPTTGPTAADILNTYSVDELTRVLRDYGEERFARRIAQGVVRERVRTPWTTSAPLVELIRSSIPAAVRRTGGHPAKRSFQALRIEVNGELDALTRAIPAAVQSLRIGGRLVVMSYQSLEDRIVKRVFAAASRPDVPDDVPIVPPGHGPTLRLLTRGAERADEADVAVNPRSAPVRVRAVERIAA